MTSRLVGILGGSFDPVHHGHLRLALECLQFAGLSKVILVPLNSPSHRPSLVASPGQRYDMIRLAIADCETLEVSDIEIKREGTTYTIDTLKQLRENLNAQTMCLILGLDVFQGMDTWKDWREIPGYAHLIIANRPGERKGFRNDEIRSFFESRLANSVSELHEYSEGKLISLDVPMLDISSSRIRSLLQAGQSARYLLPDPVLDYIVKNETYIKQD